ncbi:unnamed protein product [Acanthoscelides obtectus]|uniref:Uncharacterized protein n=1 Tax=Acanthoscelides obtectus TaxID=200917 RepID=A0A9P0P3Y2_ACAOB|nr:unnamed protein product [Acanthoscelides obtectus]CAK1626812.1 Insulin-like growth factor-binding protein complex acid labile subunit [Acanthoscelides obtectus]
MIRTTVKILFIFVTVSMVGSYQGSGFFPPHREQCYVPRGRTTTTSTTQHSRDYYYDDYSQRRYGYRPRKNHDPCENTNTITIDVTCDLSFYVKDSKYAITSDTYLVCPTDRIRFFSSTNISVLRGSAFAAGFQISELHLSSLGLTKITPGAFNKQPKIHAIFLSKNNLAEITVGLFNSLEYLNELDLSENQIANVGDDAFSSVPLSKLYLSRNKLTSLPDSFAEIGTLDISYNSINKINPSVDFNTVTLNASNNKMQGFDMSKFPVIQELHLARNLIKEFEINNDNETLEILDLYNNMLAEIPENTCSLKVLNLGANNISNLPNKPLNASSLEELNLSENNLTYIPSVMFKDLQCLKILDLSKNGISSFSFGTFDGLSNLRILNISYNGFKTLPFTTFHSAKLLFKIDFSRNEISDLDIHQLFKHLPMLHSLDFRGNAFSCHKLLEIIHVLELRKVMFIRGSDIDDDNIYGIKCSNFYEPIYDNAGGSQSNVSYKHLIDYFNKNFKNSSFVQYLGDLIKRLGMNFNNATRERTLVFEKLINRSDVSFNNSVDIHRKLYNALSNVTVEINKNSINISEFYRMLASLKQVLNDTLDSNKNDRGLLIKTFSDMDTDIKTLLDTIKITHQSTLKLLLEKAQNNASLLLSRMLEDDYLKPSHSEKLSGSSEDEVSDRANPVLILIVILLVIITVLLLGFGYVMLFRIKNINQRSDVELTRLVESTSLNVGK